jgi:hypothetical protein
MVEIHENAIGQSPRELSLNKLTQGELGGIARVAQAIEAE